MKRIVFSIPVSLSLASCSKDNADTTIPETPVKDYHQSAPTQ